MTVLKNQRVNTPSSRPSQPLSSEKPLRHVGAKVATSKRSTAATCQNSNNSNPSGPRPAIRNPRPNKPNKNINPTPTTTQNNIQNIQNIQNNQNDMMRPYQSSPIMISPTFPHMMIHATDDDQLSNKPSLKTLISQLSSFPPRVDPSPILNKIDEHMKESPFSTVLSLVGHFQRSTRLLLKKSEEQLVNDFNYLLILARHCQKKISLQDALCKDYIFLWINLKTQFCINRQRCLDKMSKSGNAQCIQDLTRLYMDLSIVLLSEHLEKTWVEEQLVKIHSPPSLVPTVMPPCQPQQPMETNQVPCLAESSGPMNALPIKQEPTRPKRTRKLTSQIKSTLQEYWRENPNEAEPSFFNSEERMRKFIQVIQLDDSFLEVLKNNAASLWMEFETARRYVTQDKLL